MVAAVVPLVTVVVKEILELSKELWKKYIFKTFSSIFSRFIK
jgi:hypothetical protein